MVGFNPFIWWWPPPCFMDFTDKRTVPYPTWLRWYRPWSNSFDLICIYYIHRISISISIIYIYIHPLRRIWHFQKNHWNWKYVVKNQPSSSKIFSIWVCLLSLSLYILECQLFEHPRELYQHVLAHTEVHRLESTCKTPGSLRMGHLTDRAEEVRVKRWSWLKVREVTGKKHNGVIMVIMVMICCNDLAGIC